MKGQKQTTSTFKNVQRRSINLFTLTLNMRKTFKFYFVVFLLLEKRCSKFIQFFFHHSIFDLQGIYSINCCAYLNFAIYLKCVFFLLFFQGIPSGLSPSDAIQQKAIDYCNKISNELQDLFKIKIEKKAKTKKKLMKQY